MNTPDAKAGVGPVGVGAAASAACRAGPIVGVLAAGVASLLGAVIFGVAGLEARTVKPTGRREHRPWRASIW